MNLFNLKIGKIVGSPNKVCWSQTHVFLPEDKEKRMLYGNLLSSFAIKASKEDLDIASFGKEIISRFHEIYYSSPEESILAKLNLSIDKLIKEFANQVDLEIIAAVVVPSLEGKAVGYFAATQECKVYLLRQEQFVSLLVENEASIRASSGFLYHEDTVCLATSQFYQIIPQGTLKVAFRAKSINEVIETLAPIIHGHQKNSLAAAVIFRLKKTKTEKIPISSQEEKPAIQRKFLFSKLITLRPGWEKVKEKILKFRPKQGLYLPRKEELKGIRIQDEEKKAKAKKTTVTVAVILIVMLIASVVLGSKKKSTNQESSSVKMLQEEASYKYEQAYSLKDLNPLRARLLLSEARDLILQNIDSIENKNDKEEIIKLLNLIETELENVAREYKLKQAEIFLDLSLAKEDFKGSNWGLTEDKLYIYDAEKGTVLQVGIDNKATQVVAGGEKLVDGDLIGVSGPRAFIMKTNKILVVDIEKTEVIDEVGKEDWGEIRSLVGFAGNAYLLDIGESQIWKYRGLNNGLAKKSGYLKEVGVDLSQATSMAIDGSVWIVFSTGDIIKFTQGKQDNFSVAGLDKAFAEAVNIYTDENLDNLYVIDRKNTRIVVINKETGEYMSQYVWPGIAGVTDIVALEEAKKILLLVGERIYEIELKN